MDRDSRHNSITIEESISVRIPARLVGRFSIGALRIWLWCRGLDDSVDKYSKNLGSGKTTFKIQAATKFFGVSASTIRRWLVEALQQGLLRNYITKQKIATCYYSSIHRVAAIANLSELGPVAEVNLEDLRELSITATEIEAESLQQQSFYAAKEGEKQRLKRNHQGNKPQMVAPSDVWYTQTCETPARVTGGKARILGSNQRFIYVSEGFVSYGASIAGISLRRAVSPRTIQRHLSNDYRLTPSPVRECRAGLTPCLKKQIAQRMPRGFVLLHGRETDNARFCKISDRVFLAKTNLYYPSHSLISYRYRRNSYKDCLSSKSGSPGGSLGLKKLMNGKRVKQPHPAK